MTSRAQGNIFKSPPLWEDVSLIVELSKSLSNERPLVTLIYEVKSSLHFNDPFTDQSSSTQVTDFMSDLARKISDFATNAIGANCTKVSSGATKSEKDAIQIVKGRLSKERQDQLNTWLQGNR